MDLGEKQAWLRRELERRGWSPAELAKRAQPMADAAGYGVKFNQQLVWNFLNTAKKMPGWFRYAEEALRDEGEETPLSPRPSNDDTVMLRQVDLAYSMGPGSNIEDYPEEGMIQFDPGLLSTITRSPPDRLFVARGSGDSMFPTLLNDDMVVIDTLQRQLNMQDRIWAISLHGAGGIKRLRTIGKGRVLVISDNKDVDNQEADAEDLFIAGRVIWVGRRV